MKSTLGPFVLLASAALAPPAAARAATPAQIDDAINKACAYLHKAENAQGDWEVRAPGENETAANVVFTGKYRGGLTALAVWALLSSGERPRDPGLVSAINLLEQLDMAQVYSVGVRCQIWPLLPQTPEVKRLARRDALLLMQLMHHAGEADGLYYYGPVPATSYDHSISQFAVLGVSACEDTGVEVPTEYWRDTDRAWRRHQDPSGGWAYITGHPTGGNVTASMTAAGVASLFISKSELMKRRPVSEPGGGNDREIERGLNWFGGHFDEVFSDAGPFPAVRMYTLFGVARIGVASGYKYFGTVDWFDRGADYLVKCQNADGSWGRGPHDLFEMNLNDVPSTAFAILFLLRGRAPVMMNKLDYATAEPAAPAGAAATRSTARPPSVGWNDRPRDAFNLAHWAGKQVERNLNWQVVNLQAPVADLHDAPVLLVTGHGALDLTPQQQDKLREFVEEGGLILGNADGASAAFGRSFVDLGRTLFPKYEFRKLPDDHPIYTEELFSRKNWKNAPDLAGLSNGVRELMLLSAAGDLGRSWQQSDRMASEPALQLGTDIYLYSVGGAIPRWKGDTGRGSAAATATGPGGTVTLTRLQYAGNWDPEPGGWRRFKADLLQAGKIDLRVNDAKLGTDPLPVGGVAHLTGTDAVAFTADQQAALRKFVVDDGGTLLIDAAGHSPAFAASVESALRTTFAADAAQLNEPLAADSPVYDGDFGKLTQVRYRRSALKVIGASRAPRLRGIALNGRLAVFYSPEDLSGGLVGQDTDGIVGYDPESAFAVMSHVLSYAMRTRPR